MRSIHIPIIYNFKFEYLEYGVTHINDFDIWRTNYFKIILNKKKARKMVYKKLLIYIYIPDYLNILREVNYNLLRILR